MTINKIDYEWASTGTKTPAPSDEKIQTGWVKGERVPMEYFNWVLARLDDKVNRLIREKIDSFYTDAANPAKMLTTGIWDEDWGSSIGAQNYFDASDNTKEYIDVKVYFTSDNEPRLLVLDKGADKIDVVDPRTLTLLDTSSDLTDDLQAGKTYYAQSMCTDGTYVYVVYGNSTDSTVDIQCWQISDWSVRSGWAATGYALTGSVTVSTTQRIAKVIIANDTSVAVVMDTLTTVDSTTEILSLVTRAGGGESDTGAGDCPASRTAMPQICSDGTYLYFLADNGSTTGNVCSADLADLTSGCGGSNYPLAVTASSAIYGSICACGDKIVSIWGDLAIGSAETFLRTHSSADADLDQVLAGTSISTTVVSTTYIDMVEPWAGMCFDGLNVWFSGVVSNHAANPGAYERTLTKVDLARLMNQDSSVSKTIFELAKGPYYVADDIGLINTDVRWGSEIAFDGRDIWCCPEPSPSKTASGRVYRLPMALMRG